MAEWRLFRGWTPGELRERLDRLPTLAKNFEGVEEDMTGDRGWRHYHSEAVVAIEPEGDIMFGRARQAVATCQFSNPDIVVAHLDPNVPLLLRRLLLEIRLFGLHYLCPAVVSRVREESRVYGFRYDTLDGHIEQGVEWFLLTKNAQGEIRFRIEARWRRGDFPNWWSHLGFILLAERYQRRWHRDAHRRLSLLSHYGSLAPPARDAAGLTHGGLNVVFTYHDQRRDRGD
jgi:uncharacterized protein (UPF0548 family)